MTDSKVQMLKYLDVGFRYGQVVSIGTARTTFAQDVAVLIRVCTEFYQALSRLPLSPIMEQGIARIREETFAQAGRHSHGDPLSELKEGIGNVWKLLWDTNQDLSRVALNAGSILGSSHREMEFTSDLVALGKRLLDIKSWPWKFADVELLKADLAALDLPEAHVVGDLLVNPHQECAASIYSPEFDHHGTIEQNIKLLQSGVPYLGLELGPSHEHPISRLGHPGITLKLQPRHFALLSLYCQARERYTSKSLIIERWQPDPGRADDAAVHQANTALRGELRKVSLRVVLGPGRAPEWRLEEIQSSKS